MRLFVAINLNFDTKRELQKINEKLRTISTGGNFTSSENLHLTLAFLGECTSEQCESAKSSMNAINFEPLNIQIERIGRFKRGTGDIWWAGLQDNKPLIDLHCDLSAKLISADFELDSRKFKPHITIAREVVTAVNPWAIKPFGETVGTIELMKSERINGILTYTSIHRRGKWNTPITVESYNPHWAHEFERIRDFLLPHIGDIIVDIHHVGSTSVPGLSAKPIIDFDIEIESYDLFHSLKERLSKLGFEHKGDFGIAGREAFKHDGYNEFMQFNMYVCPSNSPELRRHLKLRDYLRTHPIAADEYGKLKTSLAASCVNDIDAYISGKTDFILEIINTN